MRRSEVPPDSFGFRLNAAIKRLRGDPYSDKALMLDLIKIGHKISEATVNRDRKCIRKPPGGREKVWSKLLGLPAESLMGVPAPFDIWDQRGIVDTHQPGDRRIAPGSSRSPDESHWVVCPNPFCPSATWKNGFFIEYGWFAAREEGRYCRQCGIELFYGCVRAECQRECLPLRKGTRYCPRCGELLLPIPAGDLSPENCQLIPLQRIVPELRQLLQLTQDPKPIENDISM